jgi:sugar lactone lactonase YvrE
VARAADPCARWSERVVASGLGSLENVEPDGTGGLLVSASNQNAVVRLKPDGSARVLVPNVVSPGGLRVRRGVLFFNTHDSLQSGLNDTPDGTIGRFDLKTHRRSVYARNIIMPNGLVFLPNGDALTSRDIGGPPAIFVVPHGDPAHPRTWANTDDSNGMAVDPTGTWLYANQTFKQDSPVLRIRISDPTKIEVLARVGPIKGLDDMAIDRAGILYLAANGTGELIRLDPRTRRSCVIAGGAGSGWRNTSAVKFGCGPGWPSDRLYVVGFDGVVRELTPPGPEPHARGDCSGRLRPRPGGGGGGHDWHPTGSGSG